jgi:hypothetical protein
MIEPPCGFSVRLVSVRVKKFVRCLVTKQAAPLSASITRQPVPEAAGDAYANIKRGGERRACGDEHDTG